MNKIFNKWKLLIGGLKHIMDKADEKNTQASRKLISKAEKQIVFLKDKNALVTMHFNSDVQERFKVDSKNYQKRLSSIIGQVDKEWTLYTHINLAPLKMIILMRLGKNWKVSSLKQEM